MADCFITRGGTAIVDGDKQYFTFDEAGLFQYPSVVKIPNTVTSLTNSAGCFYQHEEITGITFEEGSQITSIPMQCFNSCTSLKEIVIPETVTVISTNAFEKCSGLASVVIPACTIQNYAFQYCENLKEVIINGNIKLTGNHVFRDCFLIDSETAEYILSMHTGTSIGSNIFRGCTGITSIETDKIGGYMFQNCTSLVSAKITGHNCTATPQGVFSGCTALIDVTLSNITSLGNNYFQNCTSLTTLTLPSTITTPINANVFTGCSALSELYVEENWNCIADFSALTLSENSLRGILNNLEDLTDQTTKTLTIGSANLTTAADFVSVATSKNWTLA